LELSREDQKLIKGRTEDFFPSKEEVMGKKRS